MNLADLPDEDDHPISPFAAKTCKVELVWDSVLKRHRTWIGLIPDTREEIAAMRRDTYPEDRLLCSYCMKRVWLGCAWDGQRGRSTDIYSIQHRRQETNTCVQEDWDRNGLTRDEILAVKFNGAKEGQEHRRIKGLIAASLEVDSEFSDIQVEKRLTAPLTKAWRQPDVQAMYKGRKLVFEVQLATTFLSVIIEREKFYRSQNAIIVWIFSEKAIVDNKMTFKDIFYHNNKNAFICTDETLYLSRQRSRFHLHCFNQEYIKNISFEAITLDYDKMKVYYENGLSLPSTVATGLQLHHQSAQVSAPTRSPAAAQPNEVRKEALRRDEKWGLQTPLRRDMERRITFANSRQSNVRNDNDYNFQSQVFIQLWLGYQKYGIGDQHHVSQWRSFARLLKDRSSTYILPMTGELSTDGVKILFSIGGAYNERIGVRLDQLEEIITRDPSLAVVVLHSYYNNIEHYKNNNIFRQFVARCQDEFQRLNDGLLTEESVSTILLAEVLFPKYTSDLSDCKGLREKLADYHYTQRW